MSSAGGVSGSGGASVGGQGGATPPGGAGGIPGIGGSSPVGGAGGAGGAPPIATCSPPTCGPAVNDFFDNGKLATIRITFDPADTEPYTPAQWLDLLWSKHRHCPPFDKSTLIRAGFQYESPDGKGNIELQDVGIRLRGSKARGVNQLQGFKLDFQKWLGTAVGSARRRFADMNRLNTLSIENDPSHLMQCLSYQMLRDFGLPAPYCNHLKVYVNGAYYGLMESVEEPEIGRFLQHHFGRTAGETYEGSPSQGDCTGPDAFSDGQARLLYSGATFTGYTSQYKITRGDVSTAESHLLPMLRCGDAMQTPDDAVFKACIADWIDVHEWLRQIAAESLMPQVESFMVERNFLLYFVPDPTAPHGGRFQLASWDFDKSFHRAVCTPGNCDPFTSTAPFYAANGGTRAKLATRLTSVFKSEYCVAMRDFLNEIFKPAAVDAMASVVAPGMSNDPTTPTATWMSEVATMRAFIASHGPSALAMVNAACP
jgi:hypothetical protein